MNLRLLEESIAGLVRRHESLRTRFTWDEGDTTQHIDPPGQYRLTCIDLSAQSKSKAESEVNGLIWEFQGEKVDLSVGPAFEARIFRIATQEHVLILLADHMISDGMSNVIMDKEIWQAYEQGWGDEAAALPPPALQFGDYAVWRERTKQSRRTEGDEYWRQRENEVMPTIIPVSVETGEGPQTAPVTHISFGHGLTAQLREFADRQGVPLSNVTLTIYAAAMSRWCGKEEIVIRCPVHGRHGQPQLKNVVGFFSAYVCLRINVDRRSSLRELLAHVHDEMHLALAHRDFERMRERMPECVTTELEFHWRSAPSFGRGGQRRLPSNQVIKRKPFRLAAAAEWSLKFWCIFNETPSDICVTVRHQARLVQDIAVRQFGDDMRWIAQALIDQSLASLDQVWCSR